MFLIIFICLLFLEHDNYYEVDISFSNHENHIAGTLIIPKNDSGPFPVVVFVHGDGAMLYNANGFYRPIWNLLAERGIASFSWDKAGVGNSIGTWENQSMDDRADEVITAIELLKKRKDILSDKIGLIGFSQAGWVMPIVSTKSDFPDFMIIVSGAVNWIKQGDYVSKNRMVLKGFAREQISEGLARNKKENNLLLPESTYEDYLKFFKNLGPEFQKKNNKPMTQDRFQFAKLNWQYDSRNNLKDIRCPVLAIFGDKDLNVDFAESARVYKDEFNKSGNEDLTIRMYPNATHALLKNEYFNEIIPGIWFLIKFEILGNDAFAEGYLQYLVDWISERTNTQ